MGVVVVLLLWITHAQAQSGLCKCLYVCVRPNYSFAESMKIVIRTFSLGNPTDFCLLNLVGSSD
jgi:hypothetical protein